MNDRIIEMEREDRQRRDRFGLTMRRRDCAVGIMGETAGGGSRPGNSAGDRKAKFFECIADVIQHRGLATE